ncbi:MAG TPA: MraY family glycosyltransferase [Phycisphaerae bacterium]|nr:MraY family glycosyltransferase [Phycisphaerae bacterium]
MLAGGAALFVLAFLLSLIGTALARRYAVRLGLIDAPGHRKVHAVPTPRNGGIGIFWGFSLPLLIAMAAVLAINARTSDFVGTSLLGRPIAVDSRYIRGMQAHAPLLGLLLACTLLIHLLGLLDDRKPLPPWPKLLAQLAIAAALVFIGELFGAGSFRVLTFLGNFPAPGFFASALCSIFWIVALTNAFNFLDNMDGLSAGVAFICAAVFLIAASINGQWFVAGLLLTLMGSILGFLCFNFPPASIFMGDGGSMILGFILAALTIRTTYYQPGRAPYAVLMPLFVTAVPLYDLVIVSILRLLKGRSPMTGDTNHFSHRLTRHGFSTRSTVLIIYGVTLSTGIAAPLLALHSDSTSASLLALQLLGMLTVIAILERVGEHTR